MAMTGRANLRQRGAPSNFAALLPTNNCSKRNATRTTVCLIFLIDFLFKTQVSTLVSS